MKRQHVLFKMRRLIGDYNVPNVFLSNTASKHSHNNQKQDNLPGRPRGLMKNKETLRNVDSDSQWVTQPSSKQIKLRTSYDLYV